MSKAMVCACEEVTAADLQDAVSRGMREIESLKRYTGLGTGPCQGRSCLVAATVFLTQRAGLSTMDAQPFTPRPPLEPLRLAQLAGLVPPPPEPRSLDTDRTGSHPLRPPSPVPGKADVVIVGGGIMGLALAYHLSATGRRVVVVERGYLLEGASGRNGGGVRAQFSTPTNITLANESLEICSRFAQELGINVWFRRGGYLLLARESETVRRLEESVELHHAHGLRTRLLEPREAESLVPGLDASAYVAASFNPDDGVVFPWPFVWGYAQGAAERGARIEPFTTVVGIDVERGAVRSVHTDRGTITTSMAIIASGAWSPKVAQLAGVTLPNRPMRHEICSTEPLKPCVDPLVSDLDSGLYFSQALRGEIVGGMGDPNEPPGLNQRSSLRFLVRYSRGLLELMPRLGAVKVVRQWAGCYDVTPDRAPILGNTPGIRGLLQVSGFVGHGFMMAPAVSRRMAAWIDGEQDDLFERFSLSRFAEGRMETESMIIG